MEQATEVTGFRKWAPLVVMSLALMIIILDTTILNVSLKTIINDLHTDIQSIQWVITAYSLILASFTITGGRLGDLFGRKKMFVIGAILFAIGSFLASIAKSVGFMIVGEAVIEGFGAAMMMPATASLLVSTYRGRDRQIGFGIWGGIAAAAAALGPVFGGWLTTDYSWRWAFRINVFVVLLLVFGSTLIKEVKDEEEKPNLDYGGIILATLGLLSIVFGMIKASTYGWFIAKEPFSFFGHVINTGTLSITPVFVLIGLYILWVFYVYEDYVCEKGNTPLVSFKIFKNTQFTVGTLIIGIMGIGMTGLNFSIPVFFQAVRGLDAIHTGLGLLPMSLTMLVSAPISAFIAKYFMPKRIIQAGLMLDFIGFVVLYFSLHSDSGIWAMAPGFILFGIGAGLMMSQASNLSLSAVSIQEAGEASGVNGTVRHLGATLGAAVLGTILISSLTSGLTKGINESPVIPEQAKAAISESVSKQASSIEFGGGPGIKSGTGDMSPEIANEIVSISHNATVDANKDVLLFGAFFMLMAILISVKLPSTHNIEKHESVAQKKEEAVDTTVSDVG